MGSIKYVRNIQIHTKKICTYKYVRNPCLIVGVDEEDGVDDAGDHHEQGVPGQFRSVLCWDKKNYLTRK